MRLGYAQAVFLCGRSDWTPPVSVVSDLSRDTSIVNDHLPFERTSSMDMTNACDNSIEGEIWQPNESAERVGPRFNRNLFPFYTTD
jgi:hypothetical protein